MRRSALAALVLVTPLAAWAHGDDDVRFVAAYGTDRLGCETPAAACRTIGYAAGQAGKGGVVRVAAGGYPIDTQADLFFLSDPGADVTGGYSPDFSERAPARFPTLLVGAPHALRTALEARGFHVIVDSKWDGTGLGADPQLLAKAVAPMQASSGPAACVAGAAAGFPCVGVDLLSHLALGDFSSAPSRANDVWGFVDLNTDREYALVGLENGVAVVDVSDPAAPVEVGTIAGDGTGWRDVKVVQRHDAAAGRWHAYAYVTADLVHDRVTVIDLTGLPNRIALAARATDDLSAHNLNVGGVDPALAVPLPGREPVLYLAGSNRDFGAFRTFSLADPVAPALVAGGSGYMHDGTAALLHDAAQVAGCAAPAAGACEVLADFNEDAFALWDVTTPAAPALLSVRSFATARYVHSGSWSESGRYLFVHDELDERDAGLNTTLYVFDAADLAGPAEAGSWTGPTRAIDHNGYARGNRYYISNYARGLTVLDVTDPAAPVEAGRFDTFTVSDETAFVGAWGVYPYLPSRAVLISDIQSGLFVLADRTLDAVQGALGFPTAHFAAARGTTASLPVARTGGTSGAVSVGWEILHGSTGAADAPIARGRLDWPAGDDTDKDIDIPLPAGAGAMQRFFVRLFDPAGGATLGDVGYASVFVAPPGATPVLRALEQPVVSEAAGRALVTVQRTGSAAGAVSVDFDTVSGNAGDGDFTASSGTLTWADGDASARVIEILLAVDEAAEDAEAFTVRLGNAQGATLDTSEITVTIDAHDATAQPPAPPAQPPAPPAGNSGGGGAGSAAFVLALLCGALSRAALRRCAGSG